MHDLPLGLRGYKGRNPAFPDQATADQFFDEDQFEAYRDLGQRLADAMIEAFGLKESRQKRGAARADCRRGPGQGDRSGSRARRARLESR
jgi:hypothetical protein